LINESAAIVVAKILVLGDVNLSEALEMLKSEATGAMDAITRGTVEGVKILINVIAMLVVLVALVYLVNMFLGLLPNIVGEPLKLERILGWIMAPVTWLIGIPWAEEHTAGSLMGAKTVLNELIGYHQLAQLPEDALSERAKNYYDLCHVSVCKFRESRHYDRLARIRRARKKRRNCWARYEINSIWYSRSTNDGRRHGDRLLIQ
jgi:nucleoside permease NupC